MDPSAGHTEMHRSLKDCTNFQTISLAQRNWQMWFMSVHYILLNETNVKKNIHSPAMLSDTTCQQ